MVCEQSRHQHGGGVTDMYCVLQGLDLGTMHKLIDDELTAWRNTATERSEQEPNRGEPAHVMQTALMHS